LHPFSIILTIVVVLLLTAFYYYTRGRREVFYWILAFLIAASAMVYQRMTGPTYPVRGKVHILDREVKFRLPRSSSEAGDQAIRITTGSDRIQGYVEYKRFQTSDSLTKVPMRNEHGDLTALLPHQPPAGKLEYRVFLLADGELKALQGEEPIILRFKGQVPGKILIPHILFMIISMILAVRTGLEALRPDGRMLLYTVLTIIAVFVGGLVLGPLVQKHAFGVYWSGVPFGWDLTDNKLLIAFLVWLAALVGVIRRRYVRLLPFLAMVVMMVVYSIPHSMNGSSLDYAKYDSTGVIDNIPGNH